MSSTNFVFFGPIGKTRWPPWPLIGWDIFDFSSETTEQNSKKLDRKQDLNVLYQVCVFWADLKNKMAALASDWLRHFRLFLRNRWIEFNKTWQEARSQLPLLILCFSGWSEKQDDRPGLWLVETFTTSPKLLNRIQRNLTGSKISMSSTKFVFFGPIGKTRWRPWPLIGWDIFDFSSETAERNSQKLDGKQDLNILYQVCFFLADWKNKMAALASDWLRHFWLLLWNRWIDFNPTWQEARSQHPLPSFVHFGPVSKQKGPPWSIPLKGGMFYSGARYVALWASCLDFVTTRGIVFHKHMHFFFIINICLYVNTTPSLFQYVQSGDESAVRLLLGKPQDLDVSAKMCHPLCECDKCKSLLGQRPTEYALVTAYTRDDRGYTGILGCLVVM